MNTIETWIIYLALTEKYVTIQAVFMGNTVQVTSLFTWVWLCTDLCAVLFLYSWNPKGALMASQRDAGYIEHGQVCLLIMNFFSFLFFLLHLFSFNHNLHVLPLAFDQIFVEKLSWLHTLSLCFTYQSFLVRFCFSFTGEAVARACSVVTWLLMELHWIMFAIDGTAYNSVCHPLYRL